MEIYTVTKYNKKYNGWQVIGHFETFMDAKSEVLFDGVIYVRVNNKLYAKADFPKHLMGQWSKVINTKDFNKIYITKKGELALLFTKINNKTNTILTDKEREVQKNDKNGNGKQNDSSRMYQRNRPQPLDAQMQSRCNEDLYTHSSTQT